MNDNIEITKLIDDYYSWFRRGVITKPASNGWTEIETPMLDRHNDCLSIYVKISDGNIEITDGGYILNDLDMSGFDIKTAKRKELIQQVANGFGVKVEDGEIKTMANASNFAVRKHMILQSMISINDLFYLSSPTAVSAFFDDVYSWLNQNNVRTVDNFQLTGKSGFIHHFDFIIPRSSKQSERIVDVINTPNKQNIQNTIFKWLDTKDSRRKGFSLFAILNDSGINKTSVIDPLVSYGIRAIPWSKISDYQDMLVA